MEELFELHTACCLARQTKHRSYDAYDAKLMCATLASCCRGLNRPRVISQHPRRPTNTVSLASSCHIVDTPVTALSWHVRQLQVPESIAVKSNTVAFHSFTIRASLQHFCLPYDQHVLLTDASSIETHLGPFHLGDYSRSAASRCMASQCWYTRA